MQDLLRTPLYSEHIRLNAKMAPFSGWEMPIQYSGILDEHLSCRKSAALFDICHMGEFYFRGNIERSGVEQAFTFRVSKLTPGRCGYGLMLNDTGGIIDDLIIYKLSAEELMIVVNASRRDKDFLNIGKFLNGSALFEDISDRTAKIDLQGPFSKDVLGNIIGKDALELKYFCFSVKDFLGEKLLYSRTGYTGEPGYELYIDSAKVRELWSAILKDSRVKPAGLGARDILRLEAGLSLYGYDLDENTTPIEAGLDAFVDFSKDFNGRQALLEQKERGIKKKKIAFITVSRRTPRPHYIISSGGSEIGSVTSGVFSPMLFRGIGLGYVESKYAETGTKLIIGQGNIEIEALVTVLPFYRSRSLRN
jgi:aminomethyltransferase